MELHDVQSSRDIRGIGIQRVGVKNVHLPFILRMKDGGKQNVISSTSLSVSLPHNYKGTHMSRFIEIMNIWCNRPVAGHEIRLMLQDAREKLESKAAHLEMAFKCFLPKPSPVTRLQAAMDYECTFVGTLYEEQFIFALGVDVPVTSLCPCSKAISAYGAHNQRTIIKASVECIPGKFIWIEDLVELLECQGSSRVYPLLKREDEKHVTEQAYENPKFVEDILRDSITALRGIDIIKDFTLECESYESIHNHSAFAYHKECDSAK